MNIRQVEMTACSTRYLVNWENEYYTIILGIITGGTPSLEFSDYSFIERYPVVNKWDNSHWMKDKGRYDHQDPWDIKGPTFEVLPEGEKTVEQFLEKYVPLKKLRILRHKNLPVGEEFLHVGKNLTSIFWPFVRSRRVRDEEEKTYVHFAFDLTKSRFGTVTANSTVSCTHDLALASPWWRKYDAFVRNININNDIGRYELLSDTEYCQLCNLLREGIEQKEFVKVRRR
jgi:hypothetical protein